MKKIILASAFLISSLTGATAQVALGIEGGGTFNTLTQYVKGENRATENQIGYRGGFNISIPFHEASPLSIQAGVIFDGNSGSTSTYSKQSSTGAGFPVYETDSRQYKVNSLNVPLYLVYKLGDPVYDQNHFFFGLGPSFSFTVGGKYVQRYTNALNGNERIKDNEIPLRIGKGPYHDYSAFNIGGSIMMGYEFASGIYLKGYYTYHFNNMAPQANSFNKMEASQAGLSLGFFFKKFKKYRY